MYWKPGAVVSFRSVCEGAGGGWHTLPSQRHGLWQPLVQERLCPRFWLGEAQNVARRALQLRNLGDALIHQRREQRDGCGARPNDDDLFPLEVEVLWPELRMHRVAVEVLYAGNARRHGLLVAVVAGAHDDPFGVVDDPRGLVADVDIDDPPLLVAPPVHANHLVPVSDLLVDAKLLSRLVQVGHDALARRNGLLGLPWVELEAQRVQVRVGAHARVAKLTPCSPELMAALENGKGRVGQLCLHAVCGVDARDAAADDEDVQVRGVAVHADAARLQTRDVRRQQMDKRAVYRI